MPDIHIFIDSPGWGGSEINAIRLIDVLRKTYSVRLILNPDVAPQLMDYCVLNKVPFSFLPAGATISKIPKHAVYFLSHYRSFRSTVNIIWCHHLDSNRWLQLLFSLFFCKPIIVEQLLPENYRVHFAGSRLCKPIKRITAKRAIMVLCGYSQKVDYANQFRPYLLHVIPNVRDVDVIHNQVEKNRTISKTSDKIDLLTISRLEEQKDIYTQLKAVKIMADSDMRIHLTIVGEGSQLKHYQKVVKDLCIDNFVTFTGHQPNIIPFLIEADIFILSSLSEGLPGALIEAMAASLPCIATNVKGNNELVLHEKTGLLVPPTDPQAIVDAIKFYINQPEKRKEISQNAFKFVSERYSQLPFEQNWKELITQLKELTNLN